MSTKPLTMRLAWNAAKEIQSLRDDLTRLSEIEIDLTGELAKLERIDALLAEIVERVAHG